jgi:hypothetical protein
VLSAEYFALLSMEFPLLFVLPLTVFDFLLAIDCLSLLIMLIWSRFVGLCLRFFYIETAGFSL